MHSEKGWDRQPFLQLFYGFCQRLPHFMRIGEWKCGLFFEALRAAVPEEVAYPQQVGQRHGAAGRETAVDAHTYRPAVGECALLLVTAFTR